MVFNVADDNFEEEWNDPAKGHVLQLQIVDNVTVCIENTSNEDIYLCGNNYHIALLGPLQVHFIGMDDLRGEVESVSPPFVSPPFHVVFQDTPVFNTAAYLYRKKGGYYTREETVYLLAGVYNSVAAISAALNANVNMRRERNGFVYNFITRNGRLSIEASHKQPEPSFLEITPLISGLGLTEPANLRLRTKERVDFPNTVSVLL